MDADKIKSSSKLMTIEFITKCKIEEQFVFFIAGELKDAESFIHRMRVDLSRLRGLVRERGHVPKHFKMLVVKIMPNGERIEINKDQTFFATSTDINMEIEGHWIILKKSISRNDASGVIDDIFKDVAGGPQLDVS